MEESRSGTAVVVVVVLCAISVAVLGIAALDPGILVALIPGFSTGPSSFGRTLQVAGGLALLMPVVAAVVAHLRGHSRAAGWFVVLAVLVLLPAGVAIDRGAARVRHAEQIEAPANEPCAEFSGGDTRCPGG